MWGATKARGRYRLPADEQLHCTDDLLARGRRAEHLVRPGLQRPGAQFGASADRERQYREVRPCCAELFYQLCADFVWHVQIDDSQRSEEHTSELQSRQYLVCRLLLEKKKKQHEKP